MPNCSNCGTSLVGKPKICEKCGRPTRVDSPGMLGLGGLEYLLAFVVIGGALGGVFYLDRLSSKQSFQRNQDLTTAKHIATAASLYLDDNNGTFPPMKSAAFVAEKLRKYLKDKKEFGAAGTYIWNSDISGMRRDDMVSLVMIWLFFTPPVGNGNVVAATAATNVKFRSLNELEAIKRTSSEELAKARIKNVSTKSR